MHKYYDPKLFHVMTEEEMKREYAPKEVDGVVLGADEVAALDGAAREAAAVDVTTPEHFIAAGFDVNFVGPEEALGGDGHGEVKGNVGGGEGCAGGVFC